MKRRILSVFMAMAIMFTVIHTITIGADMDFTIVGGVLIKYNGAGGAVVIPVGVTKIGYYAFSSCTNAADEMFKVNFPLSVREYDGGKEVNYSR